MKFRNRALTEGDGHRPAGQVPTGGGARGCLFLSVGGGYPSVHRGGH